MNATLRISSSDVRKELSIQDDRTESDNRVEVTLLKGIAENNLPHTVRCKSTKPPYAERHVRWCGRSVNVKVGGKCLLWITFTSYPILYLFGRFYGSSGFWSDKVFHLCLEFEAISHGGTERKEVTQCHGGADGTKSDGGVAYRFLITIIG